MKHQLHSAAHVIVQCATYKNGPWEGFTVILQETLHKRTWSKGTKKDGTSRGIGGGDLLGEKGDMVHCVYSNREIANKLNGKIRNGKRLRVYGDVGDMTKFRRNRQFYITKVFAY